jgi:hypothetical protein
VGAAVNTAPLLHLQAGGEPHVVTAWTVLLVALFFLDFRRFRRRGHLVSPATASAGAWRPGWLVSAAFRPVVWAVAGAGAGAAGHAVLTRLRRRDRRPGRARHTMLPTTRRWRYEAPDQAQDLAADPDGQSPDPRHIPLKELIAMPVVTVDDTLVRARIPRPDPAPPGSLRLGPPASTPPAQAPPTRR